MNQMLLILLAVPVLVFLLTPKLTLLKRVLVSVLVYVILAVGLVAAVIINGDTPAPGARTITPEELHK
jgi:hypothetical protein